MLKYKIFKFDKFKERNNLIEDISIENDNFNDIIVDLLKRKIIKENSLKISNIFHIIKNITNSQIKYEEMKEIYIKRKNKKKSSIIKKIYL